MKIPYNILIQIKMSVRPYFKGFTLIFFFYNCRKQDFNMRPYRMQSEKKKQGLRHCFWKRSQAVSFFSVTKLIVLMMTSRERKREFDS